GFFLTLLQGKFEPPTPNRLVRQAPAGAQHERVARVILPSAPYSGKAHLRVGFFHVLLTGLHFTFCSLFTKLSSIFQALVCLSVSLPVSNVLVHNRGKTKNKPLYSEPVRNKTRVGMPG
ncbi:hypothetical protein, partial [Thiolapillus sp.]|uniref:hypothetical protein n=2 Tax=Thiolapillus sp. TaxID=2017437 RepID=UPI003AF660C9